MRRLRLACSWVSAAGLLAACVPAALPPHGNTGAARPVALEGDTTTSIIIANDASSLYRVDEVIAVLDGAVVLRGDLGDGAQARVDLELGAGGHAIQVLVKASYPSGSIGERCGVELRAARAFRVVERGAAVATRIETGALTLGFADRFDLAFDLRGATEIDWADYQPPPSGEAATCAKLGPIRGSVCSGELLLSGAKRDRDVIKTLCYSDRMNVLRSYANAFGETEAELQAPGGEENVSPGRRADLAAITRSAVAVRASMDGCVGADPGFVPERTRAVVGDRCTGTEPLGYEP